MNSDADGPCNAADPSGTNFDLGADPRAPVPICSRCKGKGKVIDGILSGSLKDCPECTLTFIAVDPYATANQASQKIQGSGAWQPVPSALVPQSPYASPWLPNGNMFTSTRGVDFDKLIQDSGFIKELINMVELLQIYGSRNHDPYVDQIVNTYDTKLRSMGLIP